MTPSPRPDDRQKTRVLLLTDELEVGGTQRQIVHIARSLDRSRFDIEVAYFRNRSFLADELEAAAIPVTEIPKRGRLDPVFLRRLAGFLRRRRFHVMHCFAFSGELWGAVARQLLPAAERPALVTSVRNKYDWYTPMQWRLKRWATLRSVHVVANSAAGGEYARERMGLAPGAIEVVYNGVRQADAVPPPPARPTASVLFVGRLVEQKNVPVLLRAMGRLREAGVAAELRLAGDGPLRASSEALARELQLAESVTFLGQRDDAPALMAGADFVVLPSLREGLSNVILEAMMAGRPVIASDVGGNRELVEDGVSGLLFASDDDAALARAMRRLIDDAALRERMGAAARARALERFSVDAMVRAMQRVYERSAGVVA